MNIWRKPNITVQKPQIQPEVQNTVIPDVKTEVVEQKKKKVEVVNNG